MKLRKIESEPMVKTDCQEDKNIDNVISFEDYKIAQTALSEYKDLLSVADLKEIFGVSKWTIYKEIREGQFGKPIHIGRKYKIPKLYILRKFFIN